MLQTPKWGILTFTTTVVFSRNHPLKEPVVYTSHIFLYELIFTESKKTVAGYKKRYLINTFVDYFQRFEDLFIRIYAKF